MTLVYFIQDGDYVKIGLSSDPERRVETLQNGNPRELKLLKSIKGDGTLESALHRKFWDDHIRGEWFKLSEDIKEFIGEINEENLEEIKEEISDSYEIDKQIEANRDMFRLLEVWVVLSKPKQVEHLYQWIDMIIDQLPDGVFDFYQAFYPELFGRLCNEGYIFHQRILSTA